MSVYTGPCNWSGRGVCPYCNDLPTPDEPSRAASLPTDAKARKKLPVYSGAVDYFPDALIGMAEVSYEGNEQHNPGQPLHWDRTKSQDHADCLMRHLIESKLDDEEGLKAAKQMFWRAGAYLQIKIERMRDAAKKA